MGGGRLKNPLNSKAFQALRSNIRKRSRSVRGIVISELTKP
jgi:hypothetical protein